VRHAISVSEKKIKKSFFCLTQQKIVCYKKRSFAIENEITNKGMILPPAFKRVPAIDKCFSILELLAKDKKSLGISEISRHLDLNKSTVFNIVHTLIDLNALENNADGKIALGTRFYVLGNAAGKRSELIQVAHPYLESINQKTKLSAFLGIRSDFRTVLIDKVDSAHEVKISSEIGMQMPVFAGAGIKAMLSQLTKTELDKALSQGKLEKYTPNSIVDKKAYKKEILKVREEGIAYDIEEYIEGMVAFAVPLKTNGRGLQAAIWAVGLTRQVPESKIPTVVAFLKQIALEINCRL
jgi:DNA-binding IclR family transcriptional regulator